MCTISVKRHVNYIDSSSDWHMPDPHVHPCSLTRLYLLSRDRLLFLVWLLSNDRLFFQNYYNHNSGCVKCCVAAVNRRPDFFSVLLFSGPSGSMTPILLLLRFEYRLSWCWGLRDVALFIFSHEQTQ